MNNLRFCEVFDSQRSLYGLTLKAITETIRICLDENVLSFFLNARKKEVVTIMYELYNQEKITEYVHHEIAQESRMEGRAEGTLSAIQNLMDGLGMSAQAAMAILKVPETEYPVYLQKL